MALALPISFSYIINRKRASIISILGVAMGVGFFIAMHAMMYGMHDYFISKIIDVSPHITMKDEFRNPPIQPAVRKYMNDLVEIRSLKPKEETRGIRGADRIIASIEHLYSDVTVAPTLQGQAFITYGSTNRAVTVVGIVPKQERLVSNLEHDMVVGDLNNLLTNSNGVILGEGIATKTGLKMGDKISVTSPKGVILNMKVVGIFNTGITSIDEMHAYVLLKKAQILHESINRVNQINMRVKDINRADDIAKEMEATYGYQTEGWREANSNIFEIFVIQNGVMYSSIAAILIVAGFGIYNIISTMVNEKNNDIAILKSMGFSPFDIEKIFLFQGIIIGVVGAVIGWFLGYSMVEGLGSIRLSLEDEAFMSMDRFYLYKSVYQYLFGGFIALATAAFSAFIPAKKAAALDPVEILRGNV